MMSFLHFLNVFCFFSFLLKAHKKLMAFQEGALAANQLVQWIEDSLEVKT